VNLSGFCSKQNSYSGTATNVELWSGRVMDAWKSVRKRLPEKFLMCNRGVSKGSAVNREGAGLE